MDEDELDDYQNAIAFDDNNTDNETQGSPLSDAEYGTFFPLSLRKLTMFFSTISSSVNSDVFFDQPETDKLSGFNHRLSTKNSLNSQYLNRVLSQTLNNPPLITVFPIQASDTSKISDSAIYQARLMNRAKVIASGILRTRKITDDTVTEVLQLQIYQLMISEFNRLEELSLPGNIAIEIVLGNFSYDPHTHSIHCTVCGVNRDYHPGQTVETELSNAKHKQKCRLRLVTVCRLFDPEQWEEPEVKKCKCGLKKLAVISDENSLVHLFALRKASGINCLTTAETLNPGLWHPRHPCWRIITKNVISAGDYSLGILDVITHLYGTNHILNRALEARPFNPGLDFVVDYLMEIATYPDDPSPRNLASTEQENITLTQLPDLPDSEKIASASFTPFSKRPESSGIISAPSQFTEIRSEVHEYLTRLESDNLFWTQAPRGMSADQVRHIANTIEPGNSYSIFRASVQNALSQWQPEDSTSVAQPDSTSANEATTSHAMNADEFHFLASISELPEAALEELLTHLACLTQGTQESPVPVLTMEDPRIFSKEWDELLEQYKKNLRRNYSQPSPHNK